MRNQEVRFCTARDGTRIAYGITGSGPPLVFPATWQTHLELDPTLLGYGHWIEGLSTHHTLIRGELRGAGLSDRDVPSMTFDDWVMDLEAMVDDAGLERFPVFGLSHAAATAIAYTARHPQRVTQLILYAAAGRRFFDPADDVLRPKWAAYRAFLEAFWASPDPRMQTFFTSDVVPAARPEVVAALDEVRRRSMDSANAVRTFDTIISTDVMDLLPRLSVPTLILHPKRGSTITIDRAREVAAVVPNARFVVLECDNHLMQANEPGWPVLLNETWQFLGVDLTRAVNESNNGQSPAPPGPVLSRRELEVLALLATHQTNAQIAEALTIATSTASKHVHNILTKLGVSRRSEAAAWWTSTENGHAANGVHRSV